MFNEKTIKPVYPANTVVFRAYEQVATFAIQSEYGCENCSSGMYRRCVRTNQYLFGCVKQVCKDNEKSFR